MPTNKQIKSDLWDVYYKLEEAGASKVVKYAIIDVMIMMDKEEEKKEEVKCQQKQFYAQQLHYHQCSQYTITT